MFKQWCDAGRLYMKEMDLEDMAALKCCLLSAGVLFGIGMPLKWKKPATVVGSLLFVGTYLPLMTKFLGCLTKTEED